MVLISPPFLHAHPYPIFFLQTLVSRNHDIPGEVIYLTGQARLVKRPLIILSDFVLT